MKISVDILIVKVVEVNVSLQQQKKILMRKSGQEELMELWWTFLAQLRLPDGTGQGPRPGRSSLGLTLSPNYFDGGNDHLD